MVENLNYEMDESTKVENVEKSLFWNRHETIETLDDVKERMESHGVENIDLEGLDPKFQREIADSLEAMYERHPEIEGYITSVKSENLKDSALACSGPRMTENSYAGAELQFNRDFFSKRNYGLKIVDLDTGVNWRGERWLAGLGSEGVIDHEIAHVMQLKLNAESVGLEMGEMDEEKYADLQRRYFHNETITSLCYDSMREAGISPKDVGRELSVYGATDFGETFAEAISEVETRKHPRVYAQTIYNNYRKLVDKAEEVA